MTRVGPVYRWLKKDEECAEVVDEVHRHVRSRWRAVFEQHALEVDAKADDWVTVFEPQASP